MADEAKDQGAISSNGNNPAAATARTPAPSEPSTASQIADAVILEERITRVPPKSPPSEQTPPAPVPEVQTTPIAPSAPPQAPMPTPMTTPRPLAPAQKIPEIPPATNIAAPIAPAPTAPTPSVPPTPVDIPALVKAPLLRTEVPPLASGPTGPILPPQSPETVGTDITKILKSVRLPERHDQKGAADSTLETLPPTPEPPTPPLSTIAPVTPASPSLGGPQPEPEKPQNTVRSVHTLKDDLQGVVREQKMSVVRAVSLEEDRRSHEKAQIAPSTPRSKRHSRVLLAVILLFLLGVGALLSVFVIMRQRTVAPPVQTISSIIFAEQSVPFVLSDRSVGDLKRTLAEARNVSAGTLGSITRIVPVIIPSTGGTTQGSPATLSEYMHAIEAHVPDDLLRALGSDFFLGLHTVDENAPIMIIPVISYDRAFAGMLAWEGTMNADLAPVFTAVSALTTDQNGVPVARTFHDLVMRNHDVRALKDDRGEIQLYYSFPTQDILVIAESAYSFTEILSRLQAGQNL